MSRNKCLWPILILGYLFTIGVLSVVWYAPQVSGGFKFFNDLEEWRFMDKLGHVFCTYHIARVIYEIFKWAGREDGDGFIAGIVSFFMVSSIEVLDAFSEAYGFSIFDLVANGVGAGLFYAQIRLWGKPRLIPKLSFWPSGMANLRPEMLGGTMAEQIVKDYNGQIHWLSLPLFHWVSPTLFPKWLCISVGYGAGGMLFAREAANLTAGFSPFSCLYLSLDVWFSALPLHTKWKPLLILLDMAKLPFLYWMFFRW